MQYRVELSIFRERTDYLKQFLDQHSDMDLTLLRDDKRNSVIHITAFENRLDSMKMIIDHIKKFASNHHQFPYNQRGNRPVKTVIQQLINDGDLKGYTALHYASFRGNVDMIKFLQQLGGYTLSTTQSGQNLLHLAAQGNSVTSFLYLYSKLKNKLNDEDRKRSTPLHWACYYGSESVVQFLIAQPQIHLNCKDSKDETPLHIAVNKGSINIVKKLLIKGANRNLIDKDGKKPIQIAQSLQFYNIVKILNNKYDCDDRIRFYCNSKNRYEPQGQSSKPYLFLFIFLWIAGATHGLVIYSLHTLYIYISLGVNGFVLMMFLLALILPPKPQNTQYKNLIQKIPICAECRTPKLPRSYHCHICKRCIVHYDHHCPWINGCVGKHNILRFIILLFFLMIVIVENMFLQIVAVAEWPDIFKDFRFFGAPDKYRYFLRIGYILIFWTGSVINLVFFFPILLLMIRQIQNIFLNQTTYQRYQILINNSSNLSIPKDVNVSSFDEHLLSAHKDERPSCSFRNCIIMCGLKDEYDDLVY